MYLICFTFTNFTNLCVKIEFLPQLKVGELIGGSQREERYEVIHDR